MSPPIAALTLPAVAGDEQLLIPAGTFSAPDGALQGRGPWTLDDAQGAALAARLTRSGRDIPIDYEHQTLLAGRNGQPAPAAGWIRPQDIQWRPGVGLMAARVHWTERAAAMIAAGEYRFLSPVFRHDPQGRVTALLSLALTNTPAIPNHSEVRLAAASRASIHQEPPMPEPNDALRQAVATALGRPETESDEDLIAALGQALQERDDRIAALSAQVEAAVPTEVVADLQRKVADLETAALTRQVDDLVTAALADGRLLPPMEDWARNLGAKDLAALSDYLEKAVPIAALTTTQTQGQSPGGGPGDGLSDAERTVCAALGLDPEAYLAART